MFDPSRTFPQVQANEMKTDAKIDMLHQSGLFGSPVKRRQPERDLSEEEEEEEEDVEMSLVGVAAHLTSFS